MTLFKSLACKAHFLAKHRTGAAPGFDSAQNLAFADNLEIPTFCRDKPGLFGHFFGTFFC